MADNIVYLNGEFRPIESACVSVMDRGFLFGDGVYEVIPVFGDKLLRVDEHLQRLSNSLHKVSMANPHSDDEWKQLFRRLLDKNPGEDRAVYLQVTRGAYPGRDLAIDKQYPPTVFLMVLHVDAVSPESLERGISAITVDDFRWRNCDIKSVSLIANVMLKQQATQADAVDAILVRDGKVTEGTASNVFIVTQGVIVTPPKSECLLPGITRDLVIDIARDNKLAHEERDIAENELLQADEIWLTSSTREVAPVVRLNEQPVGNGKAGPMWYKVVEHYQQYKQALRDADD